MLPVHRALSRAAVAAVVLLLPSLASAQRQETETLFDSMRPAGGWGGPVVRVGDVFGTRSAFVGGRGGVSFSNGLTIGGMGIGMATNDIDEPGNANRQLELGYGGLYLEQAFRPQKLVHLTVGTLLGGGSARWTDRRDERNRSIGDNFWVIEPEAAVEVNVTKFFRVGVGGSYRRALGTLDVVGLDVRQLDGWTGGLTFKFGGYSRRR